jgi:hypothetical protein
MTLIVTVSSPETIWLVADRRISYEDRDPKDDALKLLSLNTPDEVALLGYAGLGETVRGTEPAEWMSAVLRSRNVALEQALSILAEAARRHLPAHLRRLPQKFSRDHRILVPAFLNGSQKLYSINILQAPGQASYGLHLRRHIAGTHGVLADITPRIGLAGAYSHLKAKKTWARALLHLVTACDEGKVAHDAVADRLAAINDMVYREDKSVGPRCIVAWKNRPGGVHSDGGGHRYYTEVNLESEFPAFPTIVHGIDMCARIGAMASVLVGGMPSPGQDLVSWKKQRIDALNAAISNLPDSPDERLR